MADNDYNIVKPVDGLQNIAGLTPVKRREERKRRQNTHTGKKQEINKEPNEPEPEGNINTERPEDEDDQPSIDYCA